MVCLLAVAADEWTYFGGLEVAKPLVVTVWAGVAMGNGHSERVQGVTPVVIITLIRYILPKCIEHNGP